MNKNTKKFVVTLLSVLMVLSFMPAMAFAGTPTGGHASDRTEAGVTTQYSWNYINGIGNIVDTNFDSLEEIIPPTCEGWGVGQISCDIEMNDEACAAKRTVKIVETGHKAGNKVRITAEALMTALGVDDADRAAFRTGTDNFCECYVYECANGCGAYLDKAGQKLTTANWITKAKNIDGDGKDQTTAHTKPANALNCKNTYDCAVCGDTRPNPDYNWRYHYGVESTDDPADKDLTVTEERIHGIDGNNDGQLNNTSNGDKWVQVTKVHCNLCNTDTWSNVQRRGYGSWDDVDHSDCGSHTVTTPSTCQTAGTEITYCDGCGRDIRMKTLPLADHKFSVVTPFTATGSDKRYTNGSYVPKTDSDYVYTAMVCDDCGRVKINSVSIVGFAPDPAGTETTYSVLAEANCDQGAWLLVSQKTGDTVVNTVWDDDFIETRLASGYTGTDKLVEIQGKFYVKATQKEIPYAKKLGHDYGAVTKIAEATCENRAIEGKVCSKCKAPDHATVQYVGSPLGHEKKTIKVDATCGEYGYTYDTCTRCQLLLDHKTGLATAWDIKDLERYSAKELEMMGIAYDLVNPIVAVGAPCEFEWKVTKAPTATEDGERALVCKNCHFVSKTEVIPKDSDAAKDAAIEAADPTEKAAAVILKDKAKYTADTIKAIEKYDAMLSQAIASGTAGDVTRCAQLLQKAVDDAALKAANPMTVKAKTVKAKAKKTTKIAAKKAFKVKKAQGKVTYKKKSGNGKITVSKAGKVTVKKGLKAGKTYKVKVKVTAAGNGNYLSKTKTVTLKVKVK